MKQALVYAGATLILLVSIYRIGIGVLVGILWLGAVTNTEIGPDFSWKEFNNLQTGITTQAAVDQLGEPFDRITGRTIRHQRSDHVSHMLYTQYDLKSNYIRAYLVVDDEQDIIIDKVVFVYYD